MTTKYRVWNQQKNNVYYLQYLQILFRNPPSIFPNINILRYLLLKTLVSCSLSLFYSVGPKWFACSHLIHHLHQQLWIRLSTHLPSSNQALRCSVILASTCLKCLLTICLCPNLALAVPEHCPLQCLSAAATVIRAARCVAAVGGERALNSTELSGVTHSTRQSWGQVPTLLLPEGVPFHWHPWQQSYMFDSINFIHQLSQCLNTMVAQSQFN